MSPKPLKELIRNSLRGFKPYSSARDEADPSRPAKLFLDANELSSGSPVKLDGVLADVSLNRYPDPKQLKLRTKLAERAGVGRDQVFVGVGSDEIIDLLIRLVCEPGKDSILTFSPTYGVYEVQAQLNDTRVIKVELDQDFGLDVAKTLGAIEPSTKIIFVCSPNNPTGNVLSSRAILELCNAFTGLVVVDQAYAEFTLQDPEPLVQELSGHKNLVLLKTLSKAWGLAGARLGYCFADPELVDWLLRIKAPYSINAATSAIALAALEKTDFMERESERVAKERIRVSQELRACPSVVQVHPTDANYILARFKDRDRAFEALYDRGIVVRKRSEARLRDCLRITIGTREENDLVLNTLMELS